MAKDDTLAVYTADNAKQLIQRGYTGDWRMNEARTGDIKYVMVVSRLPGERGAIKFIGKLSGVQRADYAGERPRFRLFFNEFVRVAGHDMEWEGSWPSKYLDSASDLPVNVNTVRWDRTHDPKTSKIKEYQRMIADDLGVTPDKVHISVSLT